MVQSSEPFIARLTKDSQPPAVECNAHQGAGRAALADVVLGLVSNANVAVGYGSPRRLFVVEKMRDSAANILVLARDQRTRGQLREAP